MKLGHTLLLLVFLLINPSCSRLIFTKSLPTNAEVLTFFPKELEGHYLSITYDSDWVLGSFNTLKRKGDNHMEVYSQQCVFMDSAKIADIKLGPIDTVWFENNLIQIKHGKELTKIKLEDTISSEMEKREMRINLGKESYCITEDSLPCSLKYANNSYFLNRENGLGAFKITNFKFEDSDILINHFKFDFKDSTKAKEKLIDKYSLRLYNDNQKGGFSRDYIADLRDDEFSILVQEKSGFYRSRWYKLAKDNGYYYSIVFWAFGFTLTLIFVKIVRRNSNKNQ